MYSGAVVRTTHVTGIMTDLGLLLGAAIMYPESRKNLWKLKIFLPILVSFFAGGLIGTAVFMEIGFTVLWIPVTLNCMIGLGHLIWRIRSSSYDGGFRVALSRVFAGAQFSNHHSGRISSPAPSAFVEAGDPPSTENLVSPQDLHRRTGS